MSIEKKTVPYEILIRLDADGYKASHVKDLVMLVDTESGETLSTIEGDARPVTPQECQGLLGENVSALIERAEAAAAEVVKKDDEISELRGALDAAKEEIVTLRGTADAIRQLIT